MGLPRKYARSRQSSARMNPTATWDCFKEMLKKATINATRPPINAPVINPSKTLFVETATAKPAIADNKIVPFAERLITPALSEMVSPMAANRIGAAAARMVASPMIKVLSTVDLLFLRCQAAAYAIHHHNK